jgi:hypothetical protein
MPLTYNCRDFDDDLISVNEGKNEPYSFAKMDGALYQVQRYLWMVQYSSHLNQHQCTSKVAEDD